MTLRTREVTRATGDLVVAFDPGETVGVAWWIRERREFGCGQYPIEYGDGRLRELAEVRGARDIAVRIRRLSEFARVAVTDFVIEDFSLRENSRSKNLLSPVRLCQSLLGELYELDASVWLQSPSDAKNTISDEMLKDVGWYRKGQPHSNDAARHLGLWMRRVRNGRAG